MQISAGKSTWPWSAVAPYQLAPGQRPMSAYPYVGMAKANVGSHLAKFHTILPHPAKGLWPHPAKGRDPLWLTLLTLLDLAGKQTNGLLWLR